MIKQSDSDLHLFSTFPASQPDNGSPIAMVALGELAKTHVGIHPWAIAHFSSLDSNAQAAVTAKYQEEGSVAEYYVSTLTKTVVELAQQSEDICRIELSSNSLTDLAALPGAPSAPETNPAMGLRGLARYRHQDYRPVFNLECEVIKRCQQQLGANRVEVVVPFVRTLSEAASMIDILAEQGLCRGAQGLKVWLKADLPANLILATKFLQYVDGLIIDTDNVAQYAQALDLNHDALTYLYDEQNEAVQELLLMGLKASRKVNKPVWVLNRHLPKSPRMQAWLLEQGVDRAII